MKPSRITAISLTLALLLGGCDLFGSEPDTTVFATGTVLFAETGEPIEGLGVVLRATGGFGSGIIVRARTTTDSDGSFELVFAGSEGGYYNFVVNDDPYNDQYGAFEDGIPAGTRQNYGVIELGEGL